MSQTMPTPQSLDTAPVNNPTAPFNLLGKACAVPGKRQDPLLRGSERDFADVLRERQQPRAASSEKEGLLYSLGLDDEAAFLKQKALSLLVQLGVVESGKTFAIRRPINHETKTAVHLTDAEAANGNARESRPVDAGTSLAAAAPEPDGGESVPASSPSSPDAKDSPQPQQKADQEDPQTKGTVLAENPSVLRMPVNTTLRRSLAIDLIAEKKARELLTEEAKASLLPVSGKLSAVFESGKDGVAAIGYDRRGGTSYGKYQIASRVGSMNLFLTFLQDKEPGWAERLRSAGPANTRSRWGGMPSEWKKIAAENPERFEELQDAFILATNYEPALQDIKDQANIDVATLSPAIQEVLWSTAVQHGPRGASTIFSKAMTVAQAKKSQDFDKTLINEIYRVRKSGFSSSSRRVRQAVRSRLTNECTMALEMLNDDSA